MPTTQELLTELSQPGYDGLSTAEKVTALNEQDQEYHVSVPTSEVENYLKTTTSHVPPMTLYMRLLRVYRNTQDYPEIVRLVAESAIDTVGGQIKELELDDDLYRNSVAVLVNSQAMGAADTVWTQAEADAVINLSQRFRSRAEELWGTGTVITEAEVRFAELQPQVLIVNQLAQWVAQQYGVALNQVQLVQNRLANGEDVTEEDIPTKDQLAELFRGVEE